MPTRTTRWPAGTPNWADLSVPDLPKALAFYSAVLGWELVDSGPDFGSYHIAQVDGRAAAGVGPAMTAGRPTSWTLYLATDDIDTTVDLVGQHGGSVVMPPMDVGGNGRMAVAADPTGAVFGIWQALDMIGASVYNEPGGMVWEDARLTDIEVGRAFYQEVFGWAYAGIPGVPLEQYGTFSAGADPLGGIGGMMGSPDGSPSHWLVYFGSADVDAAFVTVGELGGTVLNPAEDTPFGRIGVAADPFGAPFGLHQALPEQS